MVDYATSLPDYCRYTVPFCADEGITLRISCVGVFIRERVCTIIVSAACILPAIKHLGISSLRFTRLNFPSFDLQTIARALSLIFIRNLSIDRPISHYLRTRGQTLQGLTLL